MKDMTTTYARLRFQDREEISRGIWAHENFTAIAQRINRLSRQAVHYRRQRIQDLISISERPQEAQGRTVPGHWEGDLLMGKQKASALGTLVERITRLTLLVPLKAKDAFAVRERSFTNSLQAGKLR